jgi:hypothetical protein
VTAKQSAVKRYVVKLSDEARERLDALTHMGKHPARLLTKARILLKADASGGRLPRHHLHLCDWVVGPSGAMCSLASPHRRQPPCGRGRRVRSSRRIRPTGVSGGRANSVHHDRSERRGLLKHNLGAAAELQRGHERRRRGGSCDERRIRR